MLEEFKLDDLIGRLTSALGMVETDLAEGRSYASALGGLEGHVNNLLRGLRRERDAMRRQRESWERKHEDNEFEEVSPIAI